MYYGGLFATITTVGYGDRFPATTEGRILGGLLMSMGVGLFWRFYGRNCLVVHGTGERHEQNIGALAQPIQIPTTSAKARRRRPHRPNSLLPHRSPSTGPLHPPRPGHLSPRIDSPFNPGLGRAGIVASVRPNSLHCVRRHRCIGHSFSLSRRLATAPPHENGGCSDPHVFYRARLVCRHSSGCRRLRGARVPRLSPPLPQLLHDSQLHGGDRHPLSYIRVLPPLSGLDRDPRTPLRRSMLRPAVCGQRQLARAHSRSRRSRLSHSPDPYARAPRIPATNKRGDSRRLLSKLVKRYLAASY